MTKVNELHRKWLNDPSYKADFETIGGIEMKLKEMLDYLSEYEVSITMCNFRWYVTLYSGQTYNGRSYAEAIEEAYWDIRGHP